MIDWRCIDTVLLDMDGTLLDLHFDNYFWTEYVPRIYAERHQLSDEGVQRPPARRIQRRAGHVAVVLSGPLVTTTGFRHRRSQARVTAHDQRPTFCCRIPDPPPP